MTFLLTFTLLSIVNVVFSTVRSLVVNNGNKVWASLLSGAYFAFYNIMMQYTDADFPMLEKCAITFICNVVGVFVVKWGEEKARKDKLWKVEATIYEPYKESLIDALNKADLPFNYIEGVGKYVLFNIYCPTQKESSAVKGLLNFHKAKYFVTESKSL
jgi:hypothetical protein